MISIEAVGTDDPDLSDLAQIPRQLHVDAVVENDGLTALSVVLNGGEARPVVSRIIRTTGSVEAEMRAIILAMDYADKARWTQVTFNCDALGVVRMIQGKAICRPVALHEIRDVAMERLLNNEGWEVRWIKRTHNSCAHTMAGQIMRAYKHGREEGRREMREDAS